MFSSIRFDGKGTVVALGGTRKLRDGNLDYTGLCLTSRDPVLRGTGLAVRGSRVVTTYSRVRGPAVIQCNFSCCCSNCRVCGG